MTSEIIQCPVESCDYEGLPSSVMAHCSGKRDEAHEGGYDYWKRQIESDTPTEQPETETDDPPTDSPPEKADAAAVSFPAAESEPEPSDDEITACEACGSTDELYTPEAVLRSDMRLSPEYRELVKDSDAVCLACGAVLEQ